MSVCPACKGKLEPAENALRCGACTITYLLLGEPPDFLVEDREQSLGPLMRPTVAAIVRLYETPRWYVSMEGA